VTIGSGVDSIGGEAFGLCTSLGSISFMGSVAPASVGPGWIDYTLETIEGHAYATSNFPVPGEVWNGLVMGDVIPEPADKIHSQSVGPSAASGSNALDSCDPHPSPSTPEEATGTRNCATASCPGSGPVSNSGDVTGTTSSAFGSNTVRTLPGEVTPSVSGPLPQGFAFNPISSLGSIALVGTGSYWMASNNKISP